MKGQYVKKKDMEIVEEALKHYHNYTLNKYSKDFGENGISADESYFNTARKINNLINNMKRK